MQVDSLPAELPGKPLLSIRYPKRTQALGHINVDLNLILSLTEHVTTVFRYKMQQNRGQ